jgi:SAM-dependent methyltransferase
MLTIPWTRNLLKSMMLPLVMVYNNVLVVLGLDGGYVDKRHKWRWRTFNANRSLHENVDFSHREDVDEARKRMLMHCREIAATRIQPGKRILDIGSGTGLFAKEFASQWRVVGVDISASLTEAARRAVPNAEFYVGDFLSVPMQGQFALAYSISTLEYIPPTRLRAFLARVASLLADDGVLYLQYPHAVSRLDLYYPNLFYIKYSPAVVERAAAVFFHKIEHHHGFYREKIVERFDIDPYPKDSFVNGYVYIGRKKAQS